MPVVFTTACRRSSARRSSHGHDTIVTQGRSLPCSLAPDAYQKAGAHTLIQRYPGYSSSDILWDLADASKHARLNPAHNGRRRQLIDAGQIEPHLTGATGTDVGGIVPTGMAIPTDLRVILDDGQFFILAYVVRSATGVWRKKLGLS